MGKFTDSDLQSYQDKNEGGHDSSSKIAAAEHQARDDASKDGYFERGNDSLNSTRFSEIAKSKGESFDSGK